VCNSCHTFKLLSPLSP